MFQYLRWYWFNWTNWRYWSYRTTGAQKKNSRYQRRLYRTCW